MKKRGMLHKIAKGYLLVSTIYTGVKFIQCRGTGKERDLVLLTDAMDRINGFSVSGYDNIITIDDTEMHVTYNPYLQLVTNSLGSIAVVINGTTEVYTDAHFRNMDKNTQYAILCHEMGHYKYGHKPGKGYALNRIKAVLKGGVLRMELEADAYAASIVGRTNMCNALRELTHYVHGISRKEVFLRIKYLEKEVK